MGNDKKLVSLKTLKDLFNRVAYSGSYKDLKDKPQKICHIEPVDGTTMEEITNSSNNGGGNQVIVNDKSEFTKDETFENIVSGDSHNTIFGKLARWFDELDKKASNETFKPSGDNASKGLVPTPPSEAGSKKFLREDGVWEVPAGITAEGTSNITVDSSLSSSSTNPVQNKVVKSALDSKIDTSKITDSLVTTTSGYVASSKALAGVASDVSKLKESVENTDYSSAGISTTYTLADSILYVGILYTELQIEIHGTFASGWIAIGKLKTGYNTKKSIRILGIDSDSDSIIHGFINTDGTINMCLPQNSNNIIIPYMRFRSSLS